MIAIVIIKPHLLFYIPGISQTRIWGANYSPASAPIRVAPRKAPVFSGMMVSQGTGNQDLSFAAD